MNFTLGCLFIIRILRVRFFTIYTNVIVPSSILSMTARDSTL